MSPRVHFELMTRLPPVHRDIRVNQANVLRVEAADAYHLAPHVVSSPKAEPRRLLTSHVVPTRFQAHAPNAIMVHGNGHMEPVHFAENLTDRTSHPLSPGSMLYHLEASPGAPLVVRGAALHGRQIADRTFGLSRGQARTANGHVEVVYDLDEKRHVVAPVGTYLPIEHGSSAARADQEVEVAAAALLKKLSFNQREHMHRMYQESKTSAEQLLLDRVFIASGGQPVAVDRFQRTLSQALGPKRSDAREVLRMGTVDGLYGRFGDCALTALDYAEATLNPAKALEKVALGREGMQAQYDLELMQYGDSKKPGLSLERVVTLTNQRIAPLTGAVYEAVAGDANLADLLEAHVGGERVAPEGVQLISVGGETHHDRLCVGMHDEFDINDRRIRVFHIRDTRTGETALVSEHALGATAAIVRADIAKKMATEHVPSVAAQQMRIAGARTVSVIGSLIGHQDKVLFAAVSSDGKRAISGSKDNTVILWDLKTRKAIGEPLRHHKEPPIAGVVSADGKRAWTASEGELIHWNLETGKPIKNLPQTFPFYVIKKVWFSPDLKRGVATNNSTIQSWDLDAGVENTTPQLRDIRFGLLAVSADLKRLFCELPDIKGAKLAYTDTGEFKDIASKTESHYRPLAIGPDGKRGLTFSDLDDGVQLWDLEAKRILRPLRHDFGSVDGFALSSDSKHALLPGRRSLVHWNLETGEAAPVPEGAMHWAVFSPDGEHALAGSTDNTVKILAGFDQSWIDVPGDDDVKAASDALQSFVRSDVGQSALAREARAVARGQTLEAAAQALLERWTQTYPKADTLNEVERRQLLNALSEGPLRVEVANRQTRLQSRLTERANQRKALVEKHEREARAFEHDVLESVRQRASLKLLADPEAEFSQLVQNEWAQAHDSRTALKREVDKRLAQTRGRDVHAIWNTLLDEKALAEKALALRPDLRGGEHFRAPVMPVHTYRGATESKRKARQEKIESMVRSAKPADKRDTYELCRLLDTLSPAMIDTLCSVDLGIAVSRYKITHAAPDLEGLRGQSGGVSFVFDQAEGALALRPNKKPRITVVTYWKDGKLQLDALTLLHEIGHLYDLVVKKSADGPLHLQKDLVEAFTKENSRLPAYFQSQPEFLAETFGRYMLDHSRFASSFPLTAACYEELGFGKLLPDAGAIADIQRAQNSVSLANPSRDAVADIAGLEQLNADRIDPESEFPGPYQPYKMLVTAGKNSLAGDWAQSLATARRSLLVPNLPFWDRNDSLVRIDAKTFNDPAAMQALLVDEMAKNRASMFYLTELDQIQPRSPGFELLSQAFERNQLKSAIILAGEQRDLDRLKDTLPTLVAKRYHLHTLEPKAATEFIRRLATSEGMFLSAEAEAELEAAKKSNLPSALRELWGRIKAVQGERLGNFAKYVKKGSGEAVRILSIDVKNALSTKRRAIDELMAMPGWDEPKAAAQAFIQKARDAKLEAQANLKNPEQMKRLLLLGNNGTGKSTYLRLLARSLAEEGVLTNPDAVLIDAADLMKDPEKIVRVFDENPETLIAVDEYHQLFELKEGKPVIKKLIPILTNPKYSKSIFAGAGYEEETLKGMRDTDNGGDQGAEGRYVRVPFRNFSDQLLIEASRQQLKDRGYSPLDAQAELALTQRLQKMRRSMKFFSNARAVETSLEVAIERKRERLSGKEPSLAEIKTLVAEDFQPRVIVSKADAWKRIESIEGNASFKNLMRDIGRSVEFWKSEGKDPMAHIEPYFAMPGRPGTGKTQEIAPAMAQWFCALGLIEDPQAVIVNAGELQAGFVGQTADKVRKMFESWWGKLVLIDEASSLAMSGGEFKNEAAKMMLTQTESFRGSFMMALADYPENMAKFFAMDIGMTRRFGGQRIEPEVLGADSAMTLLGKSLAKEGFQLGDLAPLRAHIAELAALPNYASAGDVRSITNAILMKHTAAVMHAEERGERVDRHKIPDQLAEAAVHQFVESKRAEHEAQAKLESRSDEPSNKPRYATAVQTKIAAKDKEESVELTHDEQKMLGVMEEIAATMQLTQAQALQALNDPQSAYSRAVAERLGVKAAEMVQTAKKIRVKVQKMIEVQKVVKSIRKWCGFCGRPDCTFQPKQEEVQQVVTEQQMVEQIEERTVPRLRVPDAARHFRFSTRPSSPAQPSARKRGI